MGLNKTLDNGEAGGKLCEHALNCNLDIRKFIGAVDTVGEESLTDYLVWQWHEGPLKVIPFSRNYENKTSGADLEIIFIVDAKSIKKPLAIQAKKFSRDTQKNFIRDSLMYGREGGEKAYGQQFEKLQEYCDKGRNKDQVDRLPLYLIYADPVSSDYINQTKCPLSNCTLEESNNIGAFVIMIEPLQNLRIKYWNNEDNCINKDDNNHKVSLSEVLEHSFPLHNLFCNLGPDSNGGNGGNGPDGTPPPHKPNNLDNQSQYEKFQVKFQDTIPMPEYIDKLQQPNADLDQIRDEYFPNGGEPAFVAIYDLRNNSDWGKTNEKQGFNSPNTGIEKKIIFHDNNNFFPEFILKNAPTKEEVMS